MKLCGCRPGSVLKSCAGHLQLAHCAWTNACRQWSSEQPVGRISSVHRGFWVRHERRQRALGATSLEVKIHSRTSEGRGVKGLPMEAQDKRSVKRARPGSRITSKGKSEPGSQWPRPANGRSHRAAASEGGTALAEPRSPFLKTCSQDSSQGWDLERW